MSKHSCRGCIMPFVAQHISSCRPRRMTCEYPGQRPSDRPGPPMWCLSITVGDGGPELAGRWQIPARGRIWSRASSPPANERGAETSNSAAGLAAPSLAREDLRPWPGWGVACQAASCWRPQSAEQYRDAAAIFGKILSRPFPQALSLSLSLAFLLMRWPPATPAAAQ